MRYPVFDLTDKTAAVTGGTRGIGLEITRALAQAGANVVPTGHHEEQTRSAAEEVISLGRRSLVKTCNVTDTASLEHYCNLSAPSSAPYKLSSIAPAAPNAPQRWNSPTRSGTPFSKQT